MWGNVIFLNKQMLFLQEIWKKMMICQNFFSTEIISVSGDGLYYFGKKNISEPIRESHMLIVTNINSMHQQLTTPNRLEMQGVSCRCGRKMRRNSNVPVLAMRGRLCV